MDKMVLNTITRAIITALTDKPILPTTRHDLSSLPSSPTTPLEEIVVVKDYTFFLRDNGAKAPHRPTVF